MTWFSQIFGYSKDGDSTAALGIPFSTSLLRPAPGVFSGSGAARSPGSVPHRSAGRPWAHSPIPTPSVLWGGSGSTWESSCTFLGVKSRGITTFKPCLSHCTCPSFSGKAFSARPVVPTEQVSWWNGCSLLSDSGRMRRLCKKKNTCFKVWLMQQVPLKENWKVRAATVPLSPLPPGVGFTFLTIGISCHFRHLRVVPPSWAQQADAGLQSLCLSRGAAGGDCQQWWLQRPPDRQGSQDGHTDPIPRTSGTCARPAATAALGQVCLWDIHGVWTM